MAWTFPSSVLGGTAANGANCTIETSFFSSSASPGDILLVWGGHPNTGQPAGPTSGGMTGFTEIFQNSTTVRFAAHYKILTADDISGFLDVVCLGSGNSNDTCAYQACHFSGGDVANPIDNSYTIAGGTGEPNSPSITTVTDQAVVLSLFGLAERKTVIISGPSGYNNASIQGGTSETNNFSTGFAWKEVSPAGAENPAPWDLQGTPTAGYRAASVALRILQGTVADGALSATGTGTATFTERSTTTAPAVFSATGTGTGSFVAAVTESRAASMTGTGTATFGGNSLIPVPFSMTGTGTASWVEGSLSVGGGALQTVVGDVSSFRGAPFVAAVAALTGSGEASFVGTSFAVTGAFTMTGTGTMSMAGSLAGAGNLSASATSQIIFIGATYDSQRASLTGAASVAFVGATSRLSHARTTLTQRGASSVSIN